MSHKPIGRIGPLVVRAALLALGFAAGISLAQDLVPRAYLVTPLGANAVTISSSFFDGDVLTDPTAPITDSKAVFDVMSLSYSRSFDLFGRSANVVGSLPYAVGTFKGVIVGSAATAYRSGLTDGRIRFSVNLLGGPAMGLNEFRKWREKLVVGTSLTIIAPIGQYDPARLLNPGLNRWAFKPDVGALRRWGRWELDLYAGVWFYAANNAFYPGTNTRTQAPVGAGEMHLNYILRPRLWVSFDGNFWTGGRTTINETKKGDDYQRNSRLGATVSFPVTRQQSLKVSYSRGAYISIGGQYSNISAAWQYSWLSGAK